MQDNDGDSNRIFHNLEVGKQISASGTLHSMQLYSDFIQFLESEGLGLEAFTNLRGIDYDNISIHIGTVDETALEFQVGGGHNTITGTTTFALRPSERDDVDDIILGGAGGDTLLGLDGHDYIVGGKGNDILKGGGGRDFLIGGAGRDIMTGGGGKDRFVFESASDSSAARLRKHDLIRNFDDVLAGQDIIDLAGIDADETLAGDQSVLWIGTQAFSGRAGQLRFETTGKASHVQGDTDGDGVRDFLIRLSGKHDLGADDFLL